MTVHLLSAVIVLRTSMVEVEKNSALRMRMKKDRSMQMRQIPYQQYPLQGGVGEHEATSHNDSIVELKCEMSCDLAMCAENLVHNVPNTVEELKKRSVWPEWEAAIASEMDALTRNQAWTLSELPPGRKLIECRWDRCSSLSTALIEAVAMRLD